MRQHGITGHADGRCRVSREPAQHSLFVEREFASQREVFTLCDGESLAKGCRVGGIAAPKILQLGRQRPHWRRLSRGGLVGGRGGVAESAGLGAHLLDFGAQLGVTVEEVGRGARFSELRITLRPCGFRVLCVWQAEVDGGVG